MGKRIIIRLDEQVSNLSKHNLVVPESARERSTIGTILSIGEECPQTLTNKQFDGETRRIAVGDKVLFSKSAGAEIKDAEYGDVLIVRYDDCYGFIPALKTYPEATEEVSRVS